MKDEVNTNIDDSSYAELKWNSAPPLDHANDDDDEADGTLPQQAQHLPDPINNKFLPLHAEKTALLVVDVQPEYWSQCPPVRVDFPHFPEKLKNTVDVCREQTVAKIIWVRADYRYAHSPWLKQFSRIHGISSHTQESNEENNTANKTFRAEVPCDPNSEEFQWEEFAMPAGGDVIIPKSSWSSTSNTALMDILRAAGVDTVLVCGLITSVCVQHSAFGIFEAGYRTILVTDACADRGKARHEAALALYGDYMYELISSDDLQSMTSPRRLQKAKPLWALPSTKPYSPVLSPQLPPSTCSSLAPLSTSTSLSSLSSSAEASGSEAEHVITPI
jgi:nicotinamidase-related amidase